MAFDAFLKLSEIEGDSLDSGHPKEILLQSFHWGAFMGGGKAKPESLVVVKAVDRTSPTLFVKCMVGVPLASALLSVRKSGISVTGDYLKFRLTNVRIDAVRPSGTGTGDLPVEEVVLSFATMKVEVQEYTKQGAPMGPPIVGGWDFVAAKTV